MIYNQRHWHRVPMKQKKEKQKITRSTPLGSSRAGCHSYQRIYLPFPSVEHLPPHPSSCLFTRNLPNVRISLSLLLFLSDFPTPSASPFLSLAIRSHLSRHHSRAYPSHLYLSFPPSRISHYIPPSFRVRTHTASRYDAGMPKRKGSFTTCRR